MFLWLPFHKTMNSLCFLKTRCKSIFSSLHSQHIIWGMGRHWKKHLRSKQIHGRKPIWTSVHLQSLLGTLFAGYMLESVCSSSKSGASQQNTRFNNNLNVTIPPVKPRQASQDREAEKLPLFLVLFKYFLRLRQERNLNIPWLIISWCLPSEGHDSNKSYINVGQHLPFLS